jgi:hypothetical protein
MGRAVDRLPYRDGAEIFCRSPGLMNQSHESYSSTYLAHLRRGLTECYNSDELQTLCADIPVPFENLGGQGHESKARELIAYLVRRQELKVLVERCSVGRPHYPWGEQSWQGREYQDDPGIRKAISELIRLGDAKAASEIEQIYRDRGATEALPKALDALLMLLALSSDQETTRRTVTSLESVFDLMRSSVVLVSGEHRKASGFLVSERGYVITASFAMEDHERQVRVTALETEYSAEVLARDNDKKLAILKIAGMRFPFLPIRPTHTIREQDEVFILGPRFSAQPQTIHWIVSRGYLTNRLTSDGLLIAEIETKPGYAGAPVVDITGSVVAMGCARHDDKALLLPSATIVDFMREANVNIR